MFVKFNHSVDFAVSRSPHLHELVRQVGSMEVDKNEWKTLNLMNMDAAGEDQL